MSDGLDGFVVLYTVTPRASLQSDATNANNQINKQIYKQYTKFK